LFCIYSTTVNSDFSYALLRRLSNGGIYRDAAAFLLWSLAMIVRRVMIGVRHRRRGTAGTWATLGRRLNGGRMSARRRLFHREPSRSRADRSRNENTRPRPPGPKWLRFLVRWTAARQSQYDGRHPKAIHSTMPPKTQTNTRRGSVESQLSVLHSSVDFQHVIEDARQHRWF